MNSPIFAPHLRGLAETGAQGMMRWLWLFLDIACNPRHGTTLRIR